jgi:peptidoglycan hydrolase-like protein with peptidoglycan-binding domain
MRSRRAFLSLSLILCTMLFHSTAQAQAINGQPTSQSVPSIPKVNPITGPSFPCPQPSDPLAQLVCSTPQLAFLDMQFVQSYEALYQQVGQNEGKALRHEDYEFDLAVRSKCGISVSQGATNSSTPPPAAPAGSAQCVIPAYQQQIAVWKARLQGAALEEANRPIQIQLALQSRLQALGLLPASAQIDGVFGTGTRAAIMKWQASTGRQPTGLLGNADAQALLAALPQSASASPVSVPAQSQVQNHSSTSPTQSGSSVEAAWAPYTQYAACMLSKGFELQTFVHDGVLPTDAMAASVINSCVAASAQQTAPPAADTTTTSANSNTNSLGTPDSSPNTSTDNSQNTESNGASSSAPNAQTENDTQTYTAKITCLINGNPGSGVCLTGSSNGVDDPDGGSITISDGNGNHNFGVLDFIRAQGSIQVPLTEHFDVTAQEGSKGEPFQLEVQIKDSSGKVVYDDKTVSPYQTINISN